MYACVGCMYVYIRMYGRALHMIIIKWENSLPWGRSDPCFCAPSRTGLSRKELDTSLLPSVIRVCTVCTVCMYVCTYK